MYQKPKQNNQTPTDGICRNDRMIQSVCNTAHKVTEKVKGKPLSPAEPPIERWQ